jgi:hypothetical protein
LLQGNWLHILIKFISKNTNIEENKRRQKNPTTTREQIRNETEEKKNWKTRKRTAKSEVSVVLSVGYNAKECFILLYIR